jgi:hypothetical protein
MASDADAIILEPRSMLSFGEREREHTMPCLEEWGNKSE